MKIWLRNTISGLLPLYPSDFDSKRKLKLGQDYEADIKMPRNYQFHKKLFALFNLGCQNSKMDLPFEVYRKIMTVRAGYFTAYQTDKGVYYEPDSLSFTAKDEAQIEEVYSRVMDAIILDIGSTSEEIEKALIEFM
jgi:hypothetical protein